MKQKQQNAQAPESARYATLAEWRLEGLRITQADVGKRCRCRQGQIAILESGRMPQPWNRDRFAVAFGLSVPEFERLVRNAARLRALQRPLTDSHPLLAAMCAEAPAVIHQIGAPEDGQMYDREAV